MSTVPVDGGSGAGSTEATGAPALPATTSGAATPMPVADKKAPSPTAPISAVRLHMYDHCVYCMKVQIMLAFKRVPYERVLYGFGDVEGPKRLLGQKNLPVLEYVAQAHKWLKMQCEDIVAFLAGCTVETPGRRPGVLPVAPIMRTLAPSANRSDFGEWLEELQSLAAYLVLPRQTSMPVKDWARPEDKEFARKTYLSFYDFNQCLADTPEHLAEMKDLLEVLETDLMSTDQTVNSSFSMDDLDLIPELRRLTMVKGLNMPPRVQKYLTRQLKMANIASYQPHAL